MRVLNKIVEAVSGALLIAACVAFKPLCRRWYSRWGCTEAELSQALPGDEFVPHSCGGYTQAIGISTPAEALWPWLVQIGQGRGGFYSYELLENLVGCDIHNKNYIVPELQSIKVGDNIMMHPRAPAIPVAIVEPAKALVYGGSQDKDTANIWIFYIAEKDGFSRLISRWAFQYKPVFINRVVYNWLVEPIAAVMQRKMLLTIKKLAEAYSPG
jgi:hypothetical protein